MGLVSNSYGIVTARFGFTDLYVRTSVDPTPIDDWNDGYEIGKRWINTLTAHEFVLTDNTPGAAVWTDLTGGTTATPVGPAGGDLSGTYPNPNVRKITATNKTLTYNLDGTLAALTDSYGTKTLSYNMDGTVNQVVGTGIYQTKTLVYSGGKLVGVTV